jgi:Uma2 family endonuclease
MPATRVTWRDVLTMPEDGNRYEAIGGELVVSPPPKVRHQWVTERLLGTLRDLLVRTGYGYLFPAPVGVVFPGTEEGVQPDIVFVTRERLDIVGEDAIQGPPDLVIEILSPSTARRDRTVKRHLYERQGVAEYWIVDIDARQVEVWSFAAGTRDAERYTDRVPVRLGERVMGQVELATIFDWPR